MSRLLLFPLSILLLLLCGSARCEIMSWPYADMYAADKASESSFSVFPSDRAEQFSKIVVNNLTRRQYIYLEQHLGNTIHALILDRLGRYENLPGYYRAALDNGVMCEVTERPYEGAIRAMQYHSTELTEEQERVEIKAAKELGIDCESKATYDTCFCHHRNVLLYCAALKFKKTIEKSGVTKKKCEDEIIGPIDEASPFTSLKYAWLYFDDGNDKHFVRFHSNLTEELNVDIFVRAPWRYCSATELDAEQAVKEIFAANALRWTLEGYVIQEVFNKAHKNIDSACEVENFKNSEIGKCACKKETGFAFCANKVRGEYFKKIGFLKCNGENSQFSKSIKPDSLPPFICFSDASAAENNEGCTAFRAEKNKQ